MASADFFLKLDGIDGESQDARHAGEIELESWAWCESQTGAHAAGGGGGTGKVDMRDFRCEMKVNRASPKLMLACATGEHIRTAVLTCRKAGGAQQEYLRWTLTDVLVSSYECGGGSGGVPVDRVLLNFARIEVEYKEQRADGSLGGAVKVGYDLKQSRKV